ncbi:MAG: cbb3-type cytochrome c oxidase subunit 3 [Caenibius sp.]
MNPHSTYEALRHLADSYGLVVMFFVFLVLIAWPFRPGGRDRNQEAANLIFKDDNDGQ